MRCTQRIAVAGLTGLVVAALACRRVQPATLKTESRDTSGPTPASYRVVSAKSRGSEGVYAWTGSVLGDRRFELVEGPPARWSLLHGDLGSEPKLRALPMLVDCQYASLAAFDQGLTLSCARLARPKEIVLFSSDEHAENVVEVATICGEAGGHAIRAASARGDLLIVGACGRPGDYRVDELPPFLRTTAGELFPVHDAPDDLAAYSLFASRFSPRGDLYLLGDDRGGDTFLMASIDVGRTFRRRSLPPIVVGGTTYEPRLLAHTGTLRVEDDGYLVIVVPEMEMRRWIRYVSRDAGQTLDGRLLTIEADSIDLAGARGFAYVDGGDAWETNDAGGTWHAVPPPPPHPASKTDVRKLVACAEGGCLIDTSVARVGWDLQPPSGD